MQIRVGINSGEVVVRSVGSDLHVEYTAVGQTTHLAARMEQLARPGTSLITEATRRLADRHLEVESRGPVPIKGMRQPVEVWSCAVRPRLAPAIQRRAPSPASSAGKTSWSAWRRCWPG